MRNLRHSSLLLALAVGTSLTVYGALDSSLVQFDQAVRDYNLISFGNAAFLDTHDVEGTMAIGGNLSLNGNDLANQYAGSTNPALYVAGELSVEEGTQAKLNRGYAALAGNTTWSWNDTQKYLYKQSDSGESQFSTFNSANDAAKVDPRGNSAPAGWDWSSLYSTFTGISTELAAATATGSIVIDSGQNFLLDAGGITHGVVVFDLDAALLSGNSYNGAIFSKIALSIPQDLTYVVNVRNAGGKTLFGSGANFDDNHGAGYNNLLWNIVDEGGVNDVWFGGFMGAVLAPTFDVFHTDGVAMDGQVVAGSVQYSGAELHFTEFTYEVPEPATYGAIGGALCVFLVASRRRARAKAVA